MYNRVLLACLVLICLGSSCVAQMPMPGPQPGPVPPISITVTGNGEVQGKPDIAFVTLGVQTEDKEASKAAATNAATSTAVINAIVKTGVAKIDIQTVNYSLSHFKEYVQGSESRPGAATDPFSKPTYRTGYRANNDVRVKVRDLAKVGAVVDAAISAGANNAQNISFSIEDDSALKKEALTKAVQDAASKAQAIMDSEAISKLWGKGNWRPISVTENTAGPGPRPMMMAAMKSDMGAPTPIMTGEMQISAGVTVVYAWDRR